MRPTFRSIIVFLPVFLLVTASTAPSFATRVRVNTLGDGEKRITVPDEANVLLLPSLLIDFPDRVFVDVMQPSLPDLSFGGHFALSETDVIAVYGGARSRFVVGGLSTPSGSLSERSGAAATDHGATAGVLGDGDLPVGTGGAAYPASGGLGGLAGAGSTSSASAGSASATGGLGSLSSIAAPLGATPAGLLPLRADLQATVAYAHRFTDWRLGILVSAWADLDQRSKPVEEAYERRTTFVEARIGAGFDLGSLSRVDFAVVGGYAAFVNDAFDAEATGQAPLLKDEGLWQIGFVANARFALFRGGAIVPYAEFLYRGEEVSARDTAADATEDYVGGQFTGLRGTFGIDLAYEPLPGVLVQPGVGFAIEKGTLEWGEDTRLDSEIFVLPTYGVGVEAWVLDWLALRLSARQALRIVTDEWEGGPEDLAPHREKHYEVDTNVAFGVGFRFVGFTLDLLVNPDIFTTGPYGVTGEELDSLNMQAALLYEW